MTELELTQDFSPPHEKSGAQTMEGFLSSVEKRAYRMALLATKHHSDALDIVQEAMLKLAVHYQQHQAEEWGPLFQRILQRETIQWHRRQQRQHRWFWQRKHNNDDDEDPIENHSDVEHEIPERLWERAGQVEYVLSAIEKLSLRQQQAFLLRTWEGFDIAATANIMECSEGSVKTHYSRAVHELRKQLQDQREDHK